MSVVNNVGLVVSAVMCASALMPTASAMDMHMDMCPMRMTFGFTEDVCILLDQLHVRNHGQYFAAWVCVFLICVLRECLVLVRDVRFKKELDKAASKNSVYGEWGSEDVSLNARLLAGDDEQGGTRAARTCINIWIPGRSRSDFEHVSRVLSQCNGVCRCECAASNDESKGHDLELAVLVDKHIPVEAVLTDDTSNFDVSNLLDTLKNAGYEGRVSSVEQVSGYGASATSNVPPNITALLVDSIFYMVNLSLAYIIMLLIMSFNVGLCLSVVFGCGVGHFACRAVYYVYFYPSTKIREHKISGSDHCCEG